MNETPGYFLPRYAVDARIITTNDRLRMPRAASLPRFGAPRAWHDAPAVKPPGTTSSARRFGRILLAPGYLPSHAVSYLYAAFCTIGLFAFVSYMQPYLLTVNVGLAPHLQGRTVSALNFANELVALSNIVRRVEQRRACVNCRERDLCPQHAVDAIEVNA